MPSLPFQQDELLRAFGALESRLSTLEKQLQASQALAADVCQLQADVESLKAKGERSISKCFTSEGRPVEPSVFAIGKFQEESPTPRTTTTSKAQSMRTKSLKSIRTTKTIRSTRTTLESEEENQSSITSHDYFIYFAQKWEYEFQKSVYDAALFMGGHCLSPSCSALTFLSFILNMVMQLGVITLISREFMEEPFPSEEVDRFRYWRAVEGHSYNRADNVFGQSLVARVCGGDPALAMSFSQKIDNEQVLGYLQSGNGLFLCNLAVLLWTLRCCVELRLTLQLLLAFWILPRDPRSTRLTADGDAIELIILSKCRLLLAFFVGSCRSVIAILLLHYGSVWLAYTDNIEDLLLNASALGFVLEIDEATFSLFAPSTLVGILSSMRPIRLPATQFMHFIPLSFLMCSIAFLVIMNVIYLHPVTVSMRDVHFALCSDETNLDFIIGLNALGWLVYAKSAPYEAEGTGGGEGLGSEVTLEAIQLLIDKDPQASMFAFDLSQEDVTKNLGFMRWAVGRSLPQLTSDRQCFDFKPESFDGVRLGALLYRATSEVFFVQIETCSEIQEYCRGGNESIVSQNVRFLCPVTCGCADGLSGLWDLAAPDAGCPRKTCNDHMQLFWSTDYTCRDMDLEQLNSTTWTLMLTRMQQSNAFNVSVFNDLRSKGCEALKHLDESLRSSLCAHTNSFLGAGLMCPVGCGCMKGLGPYLPQTRGRHSISCPSSCENHYQCMRLGPGSKELEEYFGTRVNCPKRCQDAVKLEGWDCPLTCDETLYDESRGYRGCQNVTRKGYTCQMWMTQSPHEHEHKPVEDSLGLTQAYPGLGYHNYCRNLDNDIWIWCYTTSDHERWDYCDPVGFSSDDPGGFSFDYEYDYHYGDANGDVDGNGDGYGDGEDNFDAHGDVGNGNGGRNGDGDRDSN